MSALSDLLGWYSERTFSDVIESYFIYSDLKDNYMTEEERIEHAAGDSASRGLPNGYTISNDHVYYNGHDCGPDGKFVG